MADKKTTDKIKELAKNVTDVAIFIKPVASDTLRVNAGDNLQYEIEMHSAHQFVNRLLITSFDAIQNQCTVKDTVFRNAQEKFLFYYHVPQFNASVTSVKLHFPAWDDAGCTAETDRYLIVRARQILLQEQSGIVLWSPTTGQPNAFSFANPSQPFSYLPPESEESVSSGNDKEADLYMLTVDDFSHVILQSATKAMFVRNNNFDYATATASAVQAVYASSRRESLIDNLRINDIVLVGHDETAQGVLTVTNIVREGTEAERSIRLSFKGVNMK